MLRIIGKAGGLLAGIFLTWPLFSCNDGTSHSHNKQAAPPDSTTTSRKHTDTLKLWTELRLIKWKGWIDSSTRFIFTTDSMQLIKTEQLKSLPGAVVMPRKLFDDFKPFFLFSPDSTKALDMVSYGNPLSKTASGKWKPVAGGSDTEVALVDVKTRERKRILFTGPATIIKEVAWIDDSTLFIGGGTYNHKNQLIPELWRYNLRGQQLQNWEWR